MERSDQKNIYEVMSSSEIKVNEASIKILSSNPDIKPDDITLALKSQKFRNWIEKFNFKDHEMKSITIRDLFMFRKDIVGFICVNCEVVPKNSQVKGNQNIPGYVFIRGDAVGILIIVIDKETKKRYVLLTKQFRVPFGDWLLDVPAGMMDDKKNFKGQAAVELKEETGLEIHGDDLKELLSYGPSLGGCDETIKLFYAEIERTHQEIEDIKSKLYGNIEEGEIIKIEMLDFDVQKILGSAKIYSSLLLSILFAYQNLVVAKS